MLPVVFAVASLIDLGKPLTPAEYRKAVAHEVLTHKPLPPAMWAYYMAKGEVLACLLRPGMSEAEVRQVIGVRPSGWVREGPRWTDTYALLGLTVRYRLDDEGEWPGLVVEDVRARVP